MLPFYNVDIDGRGCLIKVSISHPQASRGSHVPPNEIGAKVVGEFKKQVPSPVFFAFRRHGTVN